MATQLVKGNSAVIIGALYAGCDCFFGYPITPASEVLQDASCYFPKLGRKFVQAESEEAAINMVYGASAAGHRAMSASSGPGISLMQEGVSYMAGAQLPCVIVNIMRAGPGLGNIGPEQGDYNQIVKGGGHGNYKAIVLAPNSVQEMCDLTTRAFNLAWKYRNPVYVLADGVLGQMVEPLQFPENPVTPVIDNDWAVAGTAETRQNVITSIILDFQQLEDYNIFLQEKYERISAHEVTYEEYRTDDADIIMVAYGISARIARSAVDCARAEGIKAGLFRPISLFPFPDAALRAHAEKKACRFVSVELSNGQMQADIRLAIACSRPVDLINRMGGSLITLDRVMEHLRGISV
ncbi:MAG: 3-methyl-2-oxobutanoate dehydrogenase subunit VorB [Spartobacteria bacterium]|nr:3-methyl-2-oxobutanoate dehydrogenase subunit VorB [Spartobacteria bacterium]